MIAGVFINARTATMYPAAGMTLRMKTSIP